MTSAMFYKEGKIVTEAFCSIPGWEGYYEISDRGTVRSVDRIVETRDGVVRNLRGKVLSSVTPGADPERWPQVCVMMSKDGKAETQMVHRLAFAAFVQGDWREYIK